MTGAPEPSQNHAVTESSLHLYHIYSHSMAKTNNVAKSKVSGAGQDTLVTVIGEGNEYFSNTSVYHTVLGNKCV